MARYTGPVVKKCRSLGIDPAALGYSKSDKKKTVEKKRRKVSAYGLQLKEKQKVKFIYGVLEKQFRLYYQKAERMRGIAGENMLILLERRLDNVVYRLGLAKTRPMARQMVSHKMITVNGKSVNIPSYLVKAGDVIAVASNKVDNAMFEIVKAKTSLALAPWLSFDNSNLCGKIETLPTREDITEPIQEHLIVELYSK